MTLSIRIIENPDPDNVLTAFPYMVIDAYDNSWFGASTFEEAQAYINFHNL